MFNALLRAVLGHGFCRQKAQQDIVETEESVEILESPEVAYDVAMRRLDEQMRQIDAIDDKIGVLITTASAVMALFAGFVSVTVKSDEVLSLIIGTAFVVLVALLYVTGITFGLRAYSFRKWELRPNWDDLLSYSKEYAEEAMKSWAAHACIASMKQNQKAIGCKLADAGCTLRLMVAQTSAASAGLVAVIIANGLTN